MMIENEQEYDQMFKVENEHWWYKTLHQKVIDVVKNLPKNSKILDLGCGTGGLLNKLAQAGFSNLSGIDFSPFAIEYCKKRRLNVTEFDIRNLKNAPFQKSSFDVIICNDVLYQFDVETITIILQNINELLSPKGIFISNNQSLSSFKGTHDIAVGSKLRFNKRQINELLLKNGFEIDFKKQHFWPFLLSPLIFVIRFFQRIQLAMNWVDLTNLKSDVSLPGNVINKFFYILGKLEKKLPFQPFWGSSIFSVAYRRGNGF